MSEDLNQIKNEAQKIMEASEAEYRQKIDATIKEEEKKRKTAKLDSYAEKEREFRSVMESTIREAEKAYEKDVSEALRELEAARDSINKEEIKEAKKESKELSKKKQNVHKELRTEIYSSISNWKKRVEEQIEQWKLAHQTKRDQITKQTQEQLVALAQKRSTKISMIVENIDRSWEKIVEQYHQDTAHVDADIEEAERNYLSSISAALQNWHDDQIRIRIECNDAESAAMRTYLDRHNRYCQTIADQLINSRQNFLSAINQYIETYRRDKKELIVPSLPEAPDWNIDLITTSIQQLMNDHRQNLIGITDKMEQMVQDATNRYEVAIRRADETWIDALAHIFDTYQKTQQQASIAISDATTKLQAELNKEMEKLAAQENEIIKKYHDDITKLDTDELLKPQPQPDFQSIIDKYVENLHSIVETDAKKAEMERKQKFIEQRAKAEANYRTRIDEAIKKRDQKKNEAIQVYRKAERKAWEEATIVG